MTAALEVLEVAGTARERGRAHGEALRERITCGLELLRAPGVESGSYLAAAARWTPEAVEELRGIAEGAAVPFEDVLVFNLHVAPPRVRATAGARRGAAATGGGQAQQRSADQAAPVSPGWGGSVDDGRWGRWRCSS